MSKINYETSVSTLDGQAGDLSDYKGKLLLIVNTASKCGFTPQYDGLEKLWKENQDKGLVVLGFPCNQFGAQEPGSAAQIEEFCRVNYGVTFPMFEKVDVNGDHAHPLFVQLKEAAPGVLGTQAIKWNFTKFLVGRDGTVLDRFAPSDTPDAIGKKIQAMLDT
jgi:glutathione peroxidase